MLAQNISISARDRILIVGGGMAGSLLALVLGRKGYSVTVFDPHRIPPPMFRNEKLGTEQVALLRELGVLSCFEDACWPDGAYPEAERPGLTDCGAPHHEWLNSVRRAWPDTVRFVETQVTHLATSSGRQNLTVSDGQTYDGRLVVLASGRMPQLRDAAGISLEMISPAHSVCLGFSVVTPAPVVSQIHHVAYGKGIAYVSLFPMPGEVRINIFSYRPMSDGWTRRMSRDPLLGLAEISPEAMQALEGAQVVRRCEARSTDLYRLKGHARDGLVLIGDAFHAPCPASGTGMLRILHDIRTLSEGYLPYWLSGAGVDHDQIAAFYADPAKRRLDARSLRSSQRGREAALNPSLHWSAYRAVQRVKRLLRS